MLLYVNLFLKKKSQGDGKIWENEKLGHEKKERKIREKNYMEKMGNVQ